MTSDYPHSYRWNKDGFVFVLDRANAEKLKAIPEFEGREEPAVAEEFLRAGVERWAESLSDAGALPGEVAVELDAHQRKAHLRRASAVLFSADI